MTNSHPTSNQRLQDQFGRRLAARLSAGNQALPHEVSERLRAARVRAVSQRKVQVAAQPVRGLALAGQGPGLDQGLGFWGWLASAVPMLALAAGLVAINLVQDQLRAMEVAEVDAALLIDDLPPAAYTDPGFAQFLKSARD